MPAVITVNDGSGRTSIPVFVYRPYASQREGRNIVTDLIGGGLAISMIPARQRADTLTCHFLTESAAKACVDLHAAAATFTLVSDEADTIGMTYVLNDSAGYRQADENLDQWVVEIGYQEIVT